MADGMPRVSLVTTTRCTWQPYSYWSYLSLNYQFSLSYNFCVADDLVIVKMVEISIIPKPDPSKFPSHFYGFGSLDATLLEIMSNSENTNPPGHSKMT